jgi:hypothetical protein
MISKKKVGRMYKNLHGFVNEKTIKKYVNKNQKIVEKINYKRSHINPNKLLLGIILFCGSLFICHMYSLWKKCKTEKKSNNINLDLNIVPQAGIY